MVRVVFFGFPVTGVLTERPSVIRFMRRFEGVVQRQLVGGTVQDRAASNAANPCISATAHALRLVGHCWSRARICSECHRKGSVSVTPCSCVLA